MSLPSTRYSVLRPPLERKLFPLRWVRRALPKGAYFPPCSILQLISNNSAFANVAAGVRNTMNVFEHKTSLPYEDVPPDLCRPIAGTRSIDLTHWSLLVNDNALRCIAMEERDRVNELAEQCTTEKVVFRTWYRTFSPIYLIG